MKNLRKICAAFVLVMALSITAFAGEISTPGGPQESPGVTGETQFPGITGQQESPGITGETQSPPGVTGDVQFPGITGDILMPGMSVLFSLIF